MTSSSKIGLRLEELMPVFEECLSRGQSVTFGPHGTSMLPLIREDRDTVTLSPLPDRLCKYDLPLYRRANGQFVLHRIVKTGPSFSCCGDNQYVFEDGVRPEQMIGVVTAITRNGKTFQTTHPLYWLYVRFWCLSRPVRHTLRRIAGKLKRILRGTT